MIPGSNILDLALQALGTQDVQWRRFVSRETNEIGLDESVFAAPVIISGSWQPVPRRAYESMGLDFTKRYATFYASANIQDIARDTSGDMLDYCGGRWQSMGAVDWLCVDGWTAILCVYVGEGDCGCAG